MSGHQPVIYHSGISFKVELLSRFSAASGALAVNISIDSDTGSDGAELLWLAPDRKKGDLLIKGRSIAQYGDALYAGQRIAEAPLVADVFSEAASDLSSCGFLEAARRIKGVGELYCRLAGINIVTAHATVRWLAKPELRVLELPISTLLSGDKGCEEFPKLVSELAYDYPRLVNVYNQTLDSYRAEHRIENQANPFPNMRSRVDNDESLGVELPLWRIAGDSRGVRREAIFSLAVDRGELKCLSAGEYLATRGSITTMLLRGFCSDLFVHGLGGAKYDQFVDRFAVAYLGIKLPSYVVASRTRVIDRERLRQLKVVLELALQVKEVVARCEGYIGKGLFSQQEECELSPLLERRGVLRNDLTGLQSVSDRSAAARELNALNSAVRGVVEGVVRRSLAQLGISTASGLPVAVEALRQQIKILGCRELGFFILDS
jgi:hypothetical protein